MVPENEFHHKEQPARAIPASQQNGPGGSGKPVTGTNKTDDGTSEDGGETFLSLYFSVVYKFVTEICFYIQSGAKRNLRGPQNQLAKPIVQRPKLPRAMEMVLSIGRFSCYLNRDYFCKITIVY